MVHGGGHHHHRHSHQTSQERFRSGSHGSGRRSRRTSSSTTHHYSTPFEFWNSHGGGGFTMSGSPRTSPSSTGAGIMMTGRSPHAVRPRCHSIDAESQEDEDFLLHGVVGDHSHNHDDDEVDGLWAFRRSSQFDDGYGEKINTPNYRCFGLALSVMVAVVLLALSGVKVTWTLNAGESRRIETPILSHQIIVTSPSQSDSVTAVVYNLEACPPLTGPPVPLEDSRSLTLATEEYQYDYFYLNTGSTIEVTVSQEQGASNVFVLEGRNALRRLESPSDDEDPFGKDIVVQGMVSAGGDVKLSYTVKQSDVYTIVYDNASTMVAGLLASHYRVVMTTYDLTHYVPICDNLRIPCRLHDPDHGNCLLVQADKKEGTDPKTHYVTVKIRGQRRWLVLVLYSLLPFVLGWVAAIILAPRTPYHTVGDGSERPPPTAPQQQSQHITPSAPLEDFDVVPTEVHAELITVIPAEHVIAVEATDEPQQWKSSKEG